jgi:hypothetical protein
MVGADQSGIGKSINALVFVSLEVPAGMNGDHVPLVHKSSAVRPLALGINCIFRYQHAGGVNPFG